MPDDNKSPKLDTSIIVALIGAAATITVALIALVPYFFPRNPPSAPTSVAVTAGETNAPTRANPTPFLTNPPANVSAPPTMAPGSVACFDRLVSGVPPQTIPVGRHFEDLPYPPDEPAPFVIVLSELGVAVGAVHVVVDKTEKLTYVRNVYDARCAPIETFENRDNPKGDKRIFDDNYTMAVSFSGHRYELTFQVKPDSLRVNNPRRID